MDISTRAQAHHRAGHTDRHAQHDAILAQIKAKEAAIERYHAAFENGTMDDTTAGPRLKTLRGESEQLKARAEEITDTIDAEPSGPPQGTIERLQTYLNDTVTSGTPAERKAAIEALIAEIRITEQGVIPVIRIPAHAHPSRWRRHSRHRYHGTGSRNGKVGAVCGTRTGSATGCRGRPG